MNILHYLNENITSIWPVLIFLIIWELAWKIIAMWKSARNNHPGWFISIGILNTLGVLPIIYILLWRKKNRSQLTAFLY